jgi:hypothetical protein
VLQSKGVTPSDEIDCYRVPGGSRNRVLELKARNGGQLSNVRPTNLSTSRELHRRQLRRNWQSSRCSRGFEEFR